MNVTSAIRRIAMNAALCSCVFLASAELGWGQSKPPEKDPAGAQAGSSGKSPDQMGSKEGKDSPLQSDTDTTTKKKPESKKKKAKKPDSTKSG